MTWNHPHTLARRAQVASLLVAGVFVVLLAAFFRLQVLGEDRYAFQSEQNRLRPVVLPAPRGLIVDRDGEVIADNVPSYTISLLASSVDSLATRLDRVGALTGLDAPQREAVIRRYQRTPGNPVVITRDAPFEVVAALEERRVDIPGLIIQTEPKRRYPHGDIVSHLLGYVGEITEDELAGGELDRVRLGTLVGRGGLEEMYDDQLRGDDGQRSVEVDARGRMVRDDPGVTGLAPRQGDTIVTALDMDLQRYVAAQFPEGRLGAVVAMDPRNGDVLAMYSAPTFDPNAFIGGVNPDLWNQWLASEGKPLLNRAVQGIYPPASPWKLAVAEMAMRRGIADLDTRMAIPCTGGMQYFSRRFRCWKLDGHGDLTLAEAIQHSCDVYFYQLGLRIGLDTLLQDGVDLGFHVRTGIDLPNESTPIFPGTTAYFDELHGPRGWTNAVTLNLSIGQGENTQTLINMVRFYAMLARDDGAAPTPRLARGAETRLAEYGLRLTEEQIMGLRQALVMVVDRGTAVRSRVANLRIAGKTGTAQNSQGPNHGWFIGFAPAEAPEVVVGAVIEFGEHGSDVAPLVTSIIARHLLGQDGARSTDLEWVVPSDSAPLPIPLDIDTTRIGPRGTQDAANGNR